jgi:hypothetical protein
MATTKSDDVAFAEYLDEVLALVNDGRVVGGKMTRTTEKVADWMGTPAIREHVVLELEIGPAPEGDN